MLGYDRSVSFMYLIIVVDVAIVYLRSSPEVCFERLKQRGRVEEKPVTLVSPVDIQ